MFSRKKKIVLLNVIYNKIIQKHNFDFAAIMNNSSIRKLI